MPVLICDLFFIFLRNKSTFGLNFFNLLYRLQPAGYFLLLTPQEVTKKEGAPILCPQIKDLGIPSQLHDFIRSRKQDSCLGYAYLNVLFK